MVVLSRKLMVEIMVLLEADTDPNASIEVSTFPICSQYPETEDTTVECCSAKSLKALDNF